MEFCSFSTLFLLHANVLQIGTQAAYSFNVLLVVLVFSFLQWSLNSVQFKQSAIIIIISTVFVCMQIITYHGYQFDWVSRHVLHKHSNTAIHTLSNFPNIYSLNAEQNCVMAYSTEHRVQSTVSMFIVAKLECVCVCIVQKRLSISLACHYIYIYIRSVAFIYQPYLHWSARCPSIRPNFA